MSVTSDDLQKTLDPLREARDLWLAENIGFTVRGERTGKAVDRAEELTRGGSGGAAERRALRERLAALRERAIGFSEVAPNRLHAQLRIHLDDAADQIGKMAWKEAGEALDAAQALIADGLQRLQQIVAINARCDGLSTVIARLGTADEAELQLVAPLVDGLVQVRRLLAPPQLDPVAAGQALATVEQQVDAVRQQLQERRGRLLQLQMLRRQRQGELVRLQQRAVDAEAGEPVLKGLSDAIEALQAPGRSADEGALTPVVEAGADALARLAPQVEAAEREKDLRERRKLLPQLRLDFEQLKTAWASSRSAALPIYLEAIDEIELDTAGLLADEARADVVAIQSALGKLKAAQDDVNEEMARVGRERKRMRRALLSYAGYLKSAPESKFWKALQGAHVELPAEIKANKDPAFQQSSAWAYESPQANQQVAEFLRLHLVVEAQAAGAEQREAYDEAQELRSARRTTFKPLARHASPVEKLAIEQLFADLRAWLDNDDIDRLDDVQAPAVQAKLDEIDTRLKALEKARTQKQDAAQVTDSLDGGHSVQRHGPDVDDDKLQNRLKNGTAPGGVFSPTRKSCRFVNYSEWETTREAALKEAERRLGVSFGPARDKSPGLAPQTFKLDHGRKVGEGFKGVGAGTFKAHPSGYGDGGQVFSAFVAMPALTKTKSTVKWDGKHWVVAQHFPTD